MSNIESISVGLQSGDPPSAGGDSPSFSDLTPVSLLANQNDWVPPAGLHGYDFELNNANREFTGIAAPTAPDQQTRWFVVTDLNGKQLKFKQENVSSLPANRFLLPGGADWTMQNNSILIVSYNHLVNRWMVLTTGQH